MDQTNSYNSSLETTSASVSAPRMKMIILAGELCARCLSSELRLWEFIKILESCWCLLVLTFDCHPGRRYRRRRRSSGVGECHGRPLSVDRAGGLEESLPRDFSNLTLEDFVFDCYSLELMRDQGSFV